jgi:import receptor subunit TOM20
VTGGCALDRWLAAVAIHARGTGSAVVKLGPTSVNRAFRDIEKVPRRLPSSPSTPSNILAPPFHSLEPTSISNPPSISIMSSSLKPSTIAAISVGTVVTGFLAYAVYFDHKRRNDADFRKQLKRESKRTQRAAKEQEEAQGAEQKKAIREAVASANEEGFPKDPEEVEAYFMQEVAQGEGMVQKGKHEGCYSCGLEDANCSAGADNVEAALCFYRALKVYPNPRELINIYDKTVPKVSVIVSCLCSLC